MITIDESLFDTYASTPGGFIQTYIFPGGMLPTKTHLHELSTRAGLAGVGDEHYEGGHWLGSFATYLLTRRGLPGD